MKSEYDDPDNWEVYKYEHFAYLKSNAKNKGKKFTLTIDDLVYPKECPILGIPITRKLKLSNSPTLDRIDNSKGYTKDNVRMISHKANRLKNNMDIATLERLLAYAKGNI